MLKNIKKRQKTSTPQKKNIKNIKTSKNFKKTSKIIWTLFSISLILHSKTNTTKISTYKLSHTFFFLDSSSLRMSVKPTLRLNRNEQVILLFHPFFTQTVIKKGTTPPLSLFIESSSIPRQKHKIFQYKQ